MTCHRFVVPRHTVYENRGEYRDLERVDANAYSGSGGRKARLSDPDSSPSSVDPTIDGCRSRLIALGRVLLVDGFSAIALLLLANVGGR